MTSSSNRTALGVEPETPSPDGEVRDGDVAWEELAERAARAARAARAGDVAGFDFAAHQTRDRSGLNALINSAFVAHRKMPMLDVIFDRTARGVSRRLRQITDENVEAVLEDVASTRFGDFLHAHETAMVIAVVRSEPLDAYGLIVADASLIMSVVDLLLGGRRGLAGGGEGAHVFTAIELSLAERLFAAVIDALNEAFSAVYGAAFALERIETTPRFAAIAQEPSVCALAKLKIRMGERSTRAYVVLPHAAIEPIRDSLMRDFLSEAAGRDEDWRVRLDEKIRAARLGVRGVLAEKSMTLGELSRLRVGDTIDFATNPQSPAALVAGDCAVARGRLGRAQDRLALRLIVGPSDDEETSAL